MISIDASLKKNAFKNVEKTYESKNIKTDVESYKKHALECVKWKWKLKESSWSFYFKL